MIAVQKFGGTCLDSAEKRRIACERIEETLEAGHKVCAVVSAMGRKGEPYATDTLIRLAKEINENVALRELDLLISCGEVISAVLMVQELGTRGIEAMALSGGQAGIKTDTNFGNASILEIDSTHVKRHLDENKVVVVAGFQGVAESGDITTLGRGGSDTTAVGLGASLGADFVEIFTDVQGIMTADPKIVKGAKTIPFVSYQEAAQTAWEGAKVIHPRAIEIAGRAQTAIYIRSMEEASKKTLVATIERAEDPFVPSSFESPVTGITYRDGLSQVTVTIPSDRPEFLADFFKCIRQVPLDMVNMFSDKVSIVIDSDHLEKMNGLKDQAEIGSRRAKITVVGYCMHGQAGIMDKVMGALWSQGIKVYASSDSNITISCLIDEDELAKGLNALHRSFDL